MCSALWVVPDYMCHVLNKWTETCKCPNENTIWLWSCSLPIIVRTPLQTWQEGPPVVEQPFGMYNICIHCIYFKLCAGKKMNEIEIFMFGFSTSLKIRGTYKVGSKGMWSVGILHSSALFFMELLLYTQSFWTHPYFLTGSMGDQTSVWGQIASMPLARFVFVLSGGEFAPPAEF